MKSLRVFKERTGETGDKKEKVVEERGHTHEEARAIVEGLIMLESAIRLDHSLNPSSMKVSELTRGDLKVFQDFLDDKLTEEEYKVYRGKLYVQKIKKTSKTREGLIAFIGNMLMKQEEVKALKEAGMNDKEVQDFLFTDFKDDVRRIMKIESRNPYFKENFSPDDLTTADYDLFKRLRKGQANKEEIANMAGLNESQKQFRAYLKNKSTAFFGFRDLELGK